MQAWCLAVRANTLAATVRRLQAEIKLHKIVLPQSRAEVCAEQCHAAGPKQTIIPTQSPNPNCIEKPWIAGCILLTICCFQDTQKPGVTSEKKKATTKSSGSTGQVSRHNQLTLHCTVPCNPSQSCLYEISDCVCCFSFGVQLQGWLPPSRESQRLLLTRRLMRSRRR